MELTGPPATLLLRRVDRVLQTLLRHRPGGGNPGRGARGERLEHSLGLIVKASRFADPVEGDDHPKWVAAKEQRGDRSRRRWRWRRRWRLVAVALPYAAHPGRVAAR